MFLKLKPKTGSCSTNCPRCLSTNTFSSRRDFKRFISAANGYDVKELKYKFCSGKDEEVIAYYCSRPGSCDVIFDIVIGEIKFMDVGDYFDLVMSREEITG